MTSFDQIQNLAKMFGTIWPGAHLHRAAEPVSGPGGTWQPAFWFTGFNQVRAVLVPLEGGCPVALDVVWTDPRAAVDAARKFATLAAGCDAPTVQRECR